MTDQGHNFIREIAEAYRALEAEPELQHKVQDYEGRHVRDGETIARLETRIMELKNAQDELNAKLRSVEAERDDAGFRHLEAEDKVNNLIRTFQDVQATVGHTTAAVTGSGKDVVVMMSAAEKAELEAFKAEQAFKAERDRLAEEARKAAEEAAKAQPMPEPVQPQPEPVSEPIPFSVLEQGQSESPPTVQLEATPSPIVSFETVGEAAGASQASQSTSEPSSGKYSGKRYHDWAYYVPLQAWLAGGGTEEDYNWRPAAIGSQR